MSRPAPPPRPLAAAAAAAPGETYLTDTPLLRRHAGSQPDLFLRWNTIPADAAAIDVVVHLHGFSQQRGAMPLADKVARSGLDLARRARPSVALLPRGNWLRHSWYDFPALLAGGLDRVVAYGLGRLASATARPAGPPRCGRLILTAHSGGVMPALAALAAAQQPPDELHLFDGLYGRDPAAADALAWLDDLGRWLAVRLAGEPQRPGALRVVYIEAETGPSSRAVAALLARQLAAAEPALRPGLARRYRVEPARVQHSQVARFCGPVLLGDAGADIDWWGGGG